MRHNAARNAALAATTTLAACTAALAAGSIWATDPSGDIPTGFNLWRWSLGMFVCGAATLIAAGASVTAWATAWDAGSWQTPGWRGTLAGAAFIVTMTTAVLSGLIWTGSVTQYRDHNRTPQDAAQMWTERADRRDWEENGQTPVETLSEWMTGREPALAESDPEWVRKQVLRTTEWHLSSPEPHGAGHRITATAMTRFDLPGRGGGIDNVSGGLPWTLWTETGFRGERVIRAAPNVHLGTTTVRRLPAGGARPR